MASGPSITTVMLHRNVDFIPRFFAMYMQTKALMTQMIAGIYGPIKFLQALD